MRMCMTLKYLRASLANKRTDTAGLVGLPLWQTEEGARVLAQGIFYRPLGGLRRQPLRVGARADVSDPPRHPLLDALSL